jgi:ferritin-like metal-binding protein YciE
MHREKHAEVIGYNTVIQMATKINNDEAIAPPRQNLQQEKGNDCMDENQYSFSLCEVIVKN